MTIPTRAKTASHAPDCHCVWCRVERDNATTLAIEADAHIRRRESEVAAALTEALAAIEAIPTSDYSTDGDAAEMVRRDDAADIVRAAIMYVLDRWAKMSEADDSAYVQNHTTTRDRTLPES
jgi:hypothetical protein